MGAPHLLLCALHTGSDDGTARVWDLRSRQHIRVMPGPGKLPVSGVLLLAQPPHLTPGSGGSQASGRAGPKRLQPLAPLAKYLGANVIIIESFINSNNDKLIIVIVKGHSL